MTGTRTSTAWRLKSEFDAAFHWRVEYSGAATSSWGLAFLRGRPPSARVSVMPPGKRRQRDLRFTLKTTCAPTTLARFNCASVALPSFSLRPQPPPSARTRAFSDLCGNQNFTARSC